MAEEADATETKETKILTYDESIKIIDDAQDISDDEKEFLKNYYYAWDIVGNCSETEEHIRERLRACRMIDNAKYISNDEKKYIKVGYNYSSTTEKKDLPKRLKEYEEIYEWFNKPIEVLEPEIETYRLHDRIKDMFGCRGGNECDPIWKAYDEADLRVDEYHKKIEADKIAAEEAAKKAKEARDRKACMKLEKMLPKIRKEGKKKGKKFNWKKLKEYAKLAGSIDTMARHDWFIDRVFLEDYDYERKSSRKHDRHDDKAYLFGIKYHHDFKKQLVTVKWRGYSWADGYMIVYESHHVDKGECVIRDIKFSKKTKIKFNGNWKNPTHHRCYFRIIPYVNNKHAKMICNAYKTSRYETDSDKDDVMISNPFTFEPLAKGMELKIGCMDKKPTKKIVEKYWGGNQFYNYSDAVSKFSANDAITTWESFHKLKKSKQKSIIKEMKEHNLLWRYQRSDCRFIDEEVGYENAFSFF